jgi:hypothetical protein
MKVSYKIEYLPEDLPVKGNACPDDPAYEKEIIKRLNRGDIAAWFCAKVECRIEENDRVFIGTDYLGANSYANEKEFESSDVIEDMKKEALSEAVHALKDAIERGKVATTIIKRHGKIFRKDTI